MCTSLGFCFANFSPSLSYLIEALHGEQVVYARVGADLVYNGDAGLDRVLVEFPHGVGAVRGRHHVSLAGDAVPRNLRVQGPGEEAKWKESAFIRTFRGPPTWDVIT